MTLSTCDVVMSAVLKFSWKKLISRKILVWYICISKKRRTPSSLKFIWDRSCCYVLYTIVVVVLVNFNHSNSSCDFLTHLATLRLNSGKFSRHSLAASTFAGDLRREKKRNTLFFINIKYKKVPSCRVHRTFEDLKTPANQSSWKNCSWCQIGRTNFKNGPHIFLYIYAAHFFLKKWTSYL